MMQSEIGFENTRHLSATGDDFKMVGYVIRVGKDSEWGKKCCVSTSDEGFEVTFTPEFAKMFAKFVDECEGEGERCNPTSRFEIDHNPFNLVTETKSHKALCSDGTNAYWRDGGEMDCSKIPPLPSITDLNPNAHDEILDNYILREIEHSQPKGYTIEGLSEIVFERLGTSKKDTMKACERLVKSRKIFRYDVDGTFGVVETS